MMADDHTGMQELIRSIAVGPNDHVCADRTGEAELRAQESAPDRVTMDLRLPSSSGLEGILAIRAARPKTQVVLIQLRSQLASSQTSAGRFSNASDDGTQ